MKKILSLVLMIAMLYTACQTAICEAPVNDFVSFDCAMTASLNYTVDDWFFNSGTRTALSCSLALDLNLNEQFAQLNFDMGNAILTFSGVAKNGLNIYAYYSNGTNGVIISFYPHANEAAYLYLDYGTPLYLQHIISLTPNEGWFLNDLEEVIVFCEDLQSTANN